jgi:hypothetical protein
MKTRDEMIYDFMLALTPSLHEDLADLVRWYHSEEGNPEVLQEQLNDIYAQAAMMADAYLKGLA